MTARSETHQLTVESTPLGKGGVFYDITRGAYPRFVRYEIPWWLCSALCVDVLAASRIAKAMTTSERVEKYGTTSLKTIYASMPEKAFKQESELEFVEMEDSAFPVELVMACTEAEYGEGHEAHLVYKQLNHPPTQRDWAWLQHNRSGALYAGYDPGRKRDQAVLVILDEVDGKLEMRMTVAMSDITFSTQRETLDAAIMNGVSQLRIDSSGLGMDMAERMEREHSESVKGISFTSKSKELLIGGGYHAMADRRLRLPSERKLIGQIASIKEVVGQSGSKLYQAVRRDGTHADTAWALLLAIESTRNNSGGQKPAYESTQKRSGARWKNV